MNDDLERSTAKPWRVSSSIERWTYVIVATEVFASTVVEQMLSDPIHSHRCSLWSSRSAEVTDRSLWHISPNSIVARRMCWEDERRSLWCVQDGFHGELLRAESLLLRDWIDWPAMNHWWSEFDRSVEVDCPARERNERWRGSCSDCWWTYSRCSSTRENTLGKDAKIDRLSIDNRRFAFQSDTQTSWRGIIQRNIECHQLSIGLVREIVIDLHILVGLDRISSVTREICLVDRLILPRLETSILLVAVRCTVQRFHQYVYHVIKPPFLVRTSGWRRSN